MDNDALSRFIEHIARSSPQVWDGMVLYHKSYAVSWLLAHSLMLAVSLVTIALSGRAFFRELPKNSDACIAHGLFLFCAAISILVNICCLPESIAGVSYPQRAAAIDMIKQIQEIPKNPKP